jgi:maltose O-acetyltransferase
LEGAAMTIFSPKRLLRQCSKRASRYIRASLFDSLSDYVAGGLTLGRDVQIQTGVKIDSSHYWHISIGDEVTICPEVQIIAHDASTIRHLGFARIGKVDIGNRAFIGAGSILLPGVHVGENSIIGAGSVVVSNIPPNVVAAGNPAKVICSLASFIEKRQKEISLSPCFGAGYTLREEVSLSMRKEMNVKMKDRFGFIK